MVKRSSELSAVMTRFLNALASRDADAIRGLVSTGDATLILGSDPREWYEGGDASELLVVQAEGMPRFEYDIHRIAAFENGSTGWAASDVTARLESGHAVALRMTAVFCLDHGVWRVVNWHTSAPEADDPEVIGVELSETMSRLVDEVGSGFDLTALTRKLRTRTATIVFTDLEDSTIRSAEVGDERWSDLIVRHFGELERIALSHDGILVKTLGDGAMFAFGSAYGAVRASLAIREMSLAVGAGTRAVAIRLGLNTGEAIATDTDFFGQAVNIAARLAGAAEAGQILASETVLTLVGDRDDIAFGPPLSVTLKGIPDVKRAFPVDRRPEPAR